MDRCKLTQEQVAKIVAGETVRANYVSPGEYGFVDHLEIEIAPPVNQADDKPATKNRTDKNLRGVFG